MWAEWGTCQGGTAHRSGRDGKGASKGTAHVQACARVEWFWRIWQSAACTHASSAPGKISGMKEGGSVSVGLKVRPERDIAPAPVRQRLEPPHICHKPPTLSLAVGANMVSDLSYSPRESTLACCPPPALCRWRKHQAHTTPPTHTTSVWAHGLDGSGWMHLGHGTCFFGTKELAA